MDQRYQRPAGRYVAEPQLEWTESGGTLYTDTQAVSTAGNLHISGNVDPTGFSFSSPQSAPYSFPLTFLTQNEGLQSQNTSSLLPHPQLILPSQAPSTPCLACGRARCMLQSHRFYSKMMLSSPKTSKNLPTRALLFPHESTDSTSTASQIDSKGGYVQQYPIVMDGERHRLLSLWSQAWRPGSHGPERHLFPTRLIDRMLPVAMNHAALFQSLLALSATLWSLANNTSDEIASRHLQYAAQMLSQACPTEEEASTDESMLSAIMIMLIYLAQGNGVEVDRHTSGLVHLAALRGGLHYLGLSGLVAELLMHVDYLQALFFDRDPFWNLTLPPLDMGLTPGVGQEFRLMVNTDELHESVVLAAVSLGRVTDIFDQSAIKDSIPADAMNALGYLSTISEYQLARCNVMYHQTSTRNECVCLALILYDLIVLRNDGAITPVIRKIEYRFWTALESAEVSGSLQGLPPYLLLWMLITGLSVCARGECQWRSLAIEKMRAVNSVVVIESWEQFRSDVLQRYLWLRATQEEAFRRIWLEVDGLKTMSNRIVTT